MPEFTCQDRISLFAKLAAGAMFVAAEPRDTATVDVQPYDGSSASQQAAENTMVEMRGTTLHVEAPEHGWRLRRSGRIRVDVRLPEDSPLIIRLASADAHFEGRYGDTTIDTASGDVTVGQVTGTLAVRGASADIRVGRAEGQTSLDTASGDVVFGFAAGDVAIDTASGDIVVEQAEGSVRVRSASGDVRIGAVRRGNLQVNAVSGDVRIGVAAGTSVWLDLATTAGTTRSDLDHGEGRTPEDGVADLNLRVRTASGDIELRRVPVPADV